MKLAHFSDTHLGYRHLHRTDGRGRNAREQDFYAVFIAAIDKILELRPDAVVHSGDLFHGYHPPAAALGVALDQIARLRDADIPFVAISGNHSTPRVAATDHVFELLNRFGGVHAVHAEPRAIKVGDLSITAVPHCNDRAQLRDWIVSSKPDSGARFNVLVAHIGLDGLGHVGSSEAGSVELDGETLEAVASYNYIALGHLHEFDRPRMNAVYAGSLERLTWADKARRKGIAIVDLAADPLDDGYLTLERVEGRLHLTLPAVDGSEVANLTEAIVDAGQRDDLDGSVVRLPITEVTVEALGAIDRHKVIAAFDRCLHFELDPQFVNASAAGHPSPGVPRELKEFVTSYVPRGMDVDEFVRRAEAFVARASEEIGA
jgi:DNA repair exonuclease SbcCD nuclease subunit